MNTNIIDYLTTEKGLKQQDIAERMGVSTAQVSKWKRKNIIAFKRERALMKLADLAWESDEKPLGYSSAFAILVKSKENEKNWIKYFDDISLSAHNIYQFDPRFLQIDFVEETLLMFNKAGIKIPDKVPTCIPDDMAEAASLSDDKEIWDVLNFDELLRTYWIAHQELQIKFNEVYDQTGNNILIDTISEMSLYKLIVEDEISFPPCDFLILAKFEKYVGNLLNEKLAILKKAIYYAGITLDVDSFYSSLFNLPQPPENSLPENVDELFYESDDDINESKQNLDDGLSNNLKSISPIIIENIIAKTIGDEVKIDFNVSISEIEYPDKSNHNKAIITFVIDNKYLEGSKLQRSGDFYE